MDQLSYTESDRSRFLTAYAERYLPAYADLSRADAAEALIPGRKDCPALRHNTYTAATRGVRGRPGAARCICPKALKLKEEALAEQRKLRSARPKQAAPSKPKANGKGTPKVNRDSEYQRTVRRTVSPPNLFGAPCTTPIGLATLEQACRNGGDKAPAAREKFKAMCLNQCRKLAECQRWVTSNEDPPGSWGKIYGGMSPNDRRRLNFELNMAERGGLD